MKQIVVWMSYAAVVAEAKATTKNSGIVICDDIIEARSMKKELQGQSKRVNIVPWHPYRAPRRTYI